VEGVEEIAHKIRVLGPYPPKVDGEEVDKRPELNSLINQINSEIESHPSNPTLLWLRGMAFRKFLTVYTNLKGEAANENYNKRRKELIDSYQSDYKEALRVSNGANDLPGSMVESGSHDVLLSGPLKEEVNRYVLRNSGPLHWQHEIGLYEKMVGVYYDEGAYDDAIRILDEMAQKFPEERERIQNMRREVIYKMQQGKEG
jgi:hypothetical protein